MPRRTLPGFALGLLLAACGAPSPPQDAGIETAREPAEVQAGDLLLRASIAPAAALGQTVAARYGIRRDRDAVLLLVGLRRLDGDTEVPLPATVTAHVRDLRGVRAPVVLREVRDGDFINYAGGVRALPPDTLTFDVAADGPDGTRLELRFSRDVLPRRP